MRLKQLPWLLLCDVGSIPGLDDPLQRTPTADGFPSPSAVADASGSVSPSPSPTPAEAAELLSQRPRKLKDTAAHLIYIRYLQRNQPIRTAIEKFGSGYQDYLQAPLQPLTDNLESVTYEVFEKDPVKYDWYERAIAQALSDWSQQGKPTSSLSGAVVIAVAGSGRGPLVTRSLRASQITHCATQPGPLARQSQQLPVHRHLRMARSIFWFLNSWVHSQTTSSLPNASMVFSMS